MEVKELMDAFAQEIGLADDARCLGGACDSKGTIPPSLRKAVIDKLNELAETRKNRVDGDYQNPFHALTKGKTLRQSRFSRIDSQNGKVLNAGTNQCFVNHLINAMLKSNDPRVNVKLRDMFRADGCTLKTDKGDVFECSYGDQSQDGEQSIFEKTLAAHLKRRCGLDRDGEFPAGTSELGAQILGLEMTGHSFDYFAIKVVDNPQPVGEVVRGIVQELAEDLAAGKFVSLMDRLKKTCTRSTCTKCRARTTYSRLSTPRRDGAGAAWRAVECAFRAYTRKKGRFRRRRWAEKFEKKEFLGQSFLVFVCHSW